MSLVAHGIISGIPMKAGLKGLAHELAEYHNKDTGLCCPSLEKLAHNLCCDVRSIRRGLAELEEAKIVTRDYRYSDGRQTTTNYVFAGQKMSGRGDASVLPEEDASVRGEEDASVRQNQKNEPEVVRERLVATKSVTPRFTPPTADDVQTEAARLGYLWNRGEAERFVDFYSSKGWVVGKAPMKDWKAAVRNWQRSRKGSSESQPFEVYL